MIPRGRGKIINIASVQSELARPGIAPYTATKGAIKQLTKGMCTDWARYGLQVNAGHGINYRNIALIHKIPHLVELNIGHSIVSRAVFIGFEAAVREMLRLMENYAG